MSRSRRKQRSRGEELHGGLAIWKPVGMTSRAAVDRAQWRLRCRGLGHTGTLDPLACGLLVLLGGEGRKFQNFFTLHDKEYVARIALGVISGSGDGEGPLSSQIPRPRLPDRVEVEKALRGFVGEYVHVPPALSAVRIGGRRSYEWAREGAAVAPKARTVHISEVELLEWSSPLLWVRVACGSGTYIRTFVRDLGERLGCGAFLVGLKRTRVGGWCEPQAASIQSLTRESWRDLEGVLRHEPRVEITPHEADCLGRGQWIRSAFERPQGVDGNTYVAWANDKVRGLVEANGAQLQARRWLSTAKPEEPGAGE